MPPRGCEARGLLKELGLPMSRVARAAASARANVCAATLFRLADACVADAKDPAVGPLLTPLALQNFFRAMGNRLSGPTTAADIQRLAGRLNVLLDALSRSGIQDSDRFNHQIEDALRALRDLVP